MLERLDAIVDDVIAPAAARVDADGAFPRAGIDALAAAGILGLTVPAEFGDPRIVVHEVAPAAEANPKVLDGHLEKAVAGRRVETVDLRKVLEGEGGLTQLRSGRRCTSGR